VRHHLHPHAQSPIPNIPPGCADVVAALDECHARGFLWKVTGNCTNAKYQVNMCLRGLRLERTRQNREEAKEKRERIEKVWKELDENK
jgi:COX assembly protein 2